MKSRGRGSSRPKIAASEPGKASALFPPVRWTQAAEFAAIPVLVVALAYSDVFRIGFLNDDFVFLDRTRGASLWSAFDPRTVPFLWYRPWSRELHYLGSQMLFGTNAVLFHVVSLVLLVGTTVAFGRLVQTIAGPASARFAAAGWMVGSAWAVPVLWIAGVQDLWMLLAGFLYLELEARQGSRAWSTTFFVIALLSKETAALLPAIAAAFLVLGLRFNVPQALRRLWPSLLALGAWAMIHPRLGGIFSGGRATGGESSVGFDLRAVWRTLGSVVNLDSGFSFMAWTTGSLLLGTLLALSLGAWIWFRAKADPSVGNERDGRTWTGPIVVWMLLGWLPAIAAGPAWHAYYGLLGSAGAWALIATRVRTPAPRVALVIAVALLGVLFRETPSTDWGRASYLRRSALFVRTVEQRLKAELPAPASHSRLFFLHIPYYVGFITPGAPVLRVWYGDPTLEGGFWSDYRPREPGHNEANDHFFRFDTTGALIEVRRAPEDIAEAERRNSRWARDHEALAAVFAKAGDWRAVAGEYEKLVSRYPQSADYLFNAGIAWFGVGDSIRGADRVLRAARAPDATPEIRGAAASLRP